MRDDRFQPGFRFSWIDAGIVASTYFVASYAATLNVLFGLIVWIVVGHFFLFCNVFRLARDLELAWAGVFLAAIISTASYDFLSLRMAGLLVAATSILVIFLGLRRASYHGLGWQIVNPQLPSWWEAKNAGSSSTEQSLADD